MQAIFRASACAVALMAGGAPALAQTSDTTADSATAAQSASDDDRQSGGANDVVVTATRREERIQDVPLSITAFQQEELTAKGIVGFEGIARETPGIVLNRPTQNFNNFTARGIATNGYNANLQSSVAVYIDELPVSTIGNTAVVDPNLFDVSASNSSAGHKARCSARARCRARCAS